MRRSGSQLCSATPKSLCPKSRKTRKTKVFGLASPVAPRLEQGHILPLPVTPRTLTRRHSPRVPGQPVPGESGELASDPILFGAAQRVLAHWHAEFGADEPGTGGPNMVDMLSALTLAIHQREIDPKSPIDEGLRSPLAYRLLELLRKELVLGPSRDGATARRAPELLVAIELIREEIEQAAPAGLHLLVEVAHDLQSPLTSILFLTDTLQRGQSGPLTELQRWQLGLIYGAALGLSAVTSDVVELAQSGGHLLETEPVPLSVHAMFESVHDIVRPVAEEKRLALRFLPPPIDQRLGHPLALTRVLLNLTTNALKFTDHGFVELQAKETRDGKVEFSITDSGRGLDPEVLERLYEPFKPNKSRRGGHAFSGTGLGLAICRKLVEVMGGQLGVETEAGKGTRFFFELDLPASELPARVQRYAKYRFQRRQTDRRSGQDRRNQVQLPRSQERRSGVDRRGKGGTNLTSV